MIWNLMVLAMFNIILLVSAQNNNTLAVCTYKCTDGCKVCSLGSCDTCLEGYTATQDKTLCQKNSCSDTNCNICGSKGECLNCKDKY